MPVRPVFLALLTGLMLTACGGDRPIVPVSERGHSLRQPESETRTVLHGDTLYSIAWESGRDYHALAAWNGLAAPYTIVVGQQLRLYPPPNNAVATPPATQSPAAKTRKTAKPSAPSARRPATAAKPAKPTPQARGNARPGKSAGPVRAVRGAASAGSRSGWIWPVQGKVLKNFDENGSGKGLNIGGSKGQPIVAAASGRVVYQGSGLRGYGQLIIVKHSDEYLSAYAHNDRIYVKEGDTVKAGQKIAAMGDSGTDQVMLHFEIRRNGKPVNPIQYLPKR